ncbi:uncharacterized protein LOC116595830 [Mustela erminea]|uniref:uncharacterized protein LOC116595830 n=1 Tax=Mustela erminea TaxID=36723 RepID=UPI00138676E7|nr:uncharacterized protein LOC116595830 [Mustela erminea]
MDLPAPRSAFSWAPTGAPRGDTVVRVRAWRASTGRPAWLPGRWSRRFHAPQLQGGGPKRAPWGRPRSLEPSDPRRGGAGAEAVSERVRARRLPRAAERCGARSDGQRRVLASCSPLLRPSPPGPRARNECGSKEESRCSEMNTSVFFNPANSSSPRAGAGAEGARAVGGETGDPERPLARPAPAGPQRSYPSRAGAAAACRSSAAAASTPSAARSRLLLGARRPRTALPRAQEGV